jgi:aryl-alcohol dehydrogenase-like predicted oxidoreductase
MHYRIFGRTGLKISVIGVGTWQFGGEWGKDFTQAEVDAIFGAAGDSTQLSVTATTCRSA